MDNIVTNLVAIADEIDRKGMTKQAVAIDRIAKNLTNIKTAQYVGIQGYWIRNERCWSNCYRIKRANNPSMAAQEVWKECQNEYVDSLNNDSDTWDKYAGEENKVLQKFAGRQSKVASSIVKAEAATFRREVNEKIASGIPGSVAIYDTITTNMSKYTEAAINNASELLKISKQFPENEKDKIKQLEVLAEQIIREAKGFGGFWEGIKGVGRGLKNVITKKPKGTTGLENLLSRLQNLLQSASSLMQDAQSFTSRTKPNTSTSNYGTPGAVIGEQGAMIPTASYNKNVKTAQTSLPVLKQDFDRFYQQLLQESSYMMKQINMLQTTGGLSSGMLGQLQGAIRLINAMTKAYPTIVQRLNTGDTSALSWGMRNFTTKMTNVLSGVQTAASQSPTAPAAPDTPATPEQQVVAPSPEGQSGFGEVQGPGGIETGDVVGPETTSQNFVPPRLNEIIQTMSTERQQQLRRAGMDAILELLDKLGYEYNK